MAYYPSRIAAAAADDVQTSLAEVVGGISPSLETVRTGRESVGKVETGWEER